MFTVAALRQLVRSILRARGEDQAAQEYETKSLKGRAALRTLRAGGIAVSAPVRMRRQVALNESRSGISADYARGAEEFAEASGSRGLRSTSEESSSPWRSR